MHSESLKHRLRQFRAEKALDDDISGFIAEEDRKATEARQRREADRQARERAVARDRVEAYRADLREAHRDQVRRKASVCLATPRHATPGHARVQRNTTARHRGRVNGMRSDWDVARDSC